jgi:hypothetical protein
MPLIVVGQRLLEFEDHCLSHRVANVDPVAAFFGTTTPSPEQ